MKPASRPLSKRGGSASGAARAETLWLYGLHAVEAALRNPIRQKLRLLATPNAARKTAAAIGESGAVIEETTPRALDRLLGGDAVHQGIALEVAPLASPDYDALREARLIVVLDQVTDPHNVGAILRSAAAFGADALMMTARHSPPLSGVLAKSASGGLEHVPVYLVRNLGEALEELGSMGVWRIGLAGEATEVVGPPSDDRPLALVLGAEGRGLRERTRSLCDLLVRIPTKDSIGALNVSNAAAVALYALTSDRDATDE